MKKYNVAIVGARGAVGVEMLKILKERNFPVDELRPMSFHPEDCPNYEFNGRSFKAVKLTHDAFEGIDIALSSPGASVSKEYSPSAVKAGAVVIDNTSQFRMDPEVPLVVPEVNPNDIKKHKGIIANPNCSTIQMVVVLKPLHDFAQIKRVVVSTYQSVSGAGQKGVEDMNTQIQALSDAPNGRVDAALIQKFPYQIVGNLIPHIDVPQDLLYTKEEIKMVNETKKIMGDNSIEVTATCVRVPVLRAHSESVNIQFERAISREKAVELLSKAPGVQVIDELAENIYPTPLEAEGKDDTYVGRIREDRTVDHGLNLWCVSDNLRKGAALNAVQIAEELIKADLV